MTKRRCRYCKKYRPVEFGSVYPGGGFFCSHDHAIKYAIEKAPKARAKLDNYKRKQDKERIKTRSDWVKETQAAFNAFIRQRDIDQPCISCQRHHSGQYHAGHYKTTAAAPELRFNELNCHKQCAPCNDHLSGNLINYRINLINKIGLDRVEWLEGPHEPKKYSIDDLKGLKADYIERRKKLIAPAIY